LGATTLTRKRKQDKKEKRKEKKVLRAPLLLLKRNSIPRWVLKRDTCINLTYKWALHFVCVFVSDLALDGLRQCNNITSFVVSS
jgi:hypothetical protein